MRGRWRRPGKSRETRNHYQEVLCEKNIWGQYGHVAMLAYQNTFWNSPPGNCMASVSKASLLVYEQRNTRKNWISLRSSIFGPIYFEECEFNTTVSKNKSNVQEAEGVLFISL